MDEIWDLVDKNGDFTGIKWERTNHVNIPEGLYHPCVEVWVRVGDRLLVTLRHPDKSEGLKYDAPGGAVLSGEEITEGALRELYEEVGIAASKDQLVRIGVALGKRSYAVTFLLSLESLPQLILQPSEVVDYKLVTRDELDLMEDMLCQGCRGRYALYKELLFK